VLNLSAMGLRNFTRLIGTGIIVLCLCVGLGQQTGRAQSGGQTPTPAPTADSGGSDGSNTADPGVAMNDTSTSTSTQADSCQAILTKAYQSIQDSCGTLGRNKACYVNDNVSAELSSGASGSFSTPGDILPIKAIRSIAASPLDLQNQTWGLSLLKLQANLPDTLPGQNVTFLVYGGTSVENTSGDMRSFYFSSTLGNAGCQELPGDGMVVSSPNHMRVTFNANGVQITIASTIVLHAQPNQTMTIGLIEGQAQVKTAAGFQTLLPGQEVSVKMGGPKGLTATGAPSAPTSIHLDHAMIVLIKVSKKAQDPQAPTTLSIDGCISKISGNTAIVGGYSLDIDPGNPQSKSLRVGSCIHVDGDFLLDGSGSLEIAGAKLGQYKGGSLNGNSGNNGNQNGTNQNGTNQNGTNQNGTNQNGTNQNGTNQNGTNQNGTKQNGTSQNGTGGGGGHK